jgi:hypothetical protein
MLYAILDLVADSVNPALALLTIFVAIVDWRAGRRRALLLMALPTLLGVASIYVVQALDRVFSLWQRYQGDYSTHTAFATTLAFSVAIWRPAWKVPVVGVWACYLALILFMRYHTISDVVVAALVALLVTVPWHLGARAVRRRLIEHSSESSAA